jgi:hypothetical protein
MTTEQLISQVMQENDCNKIQAISALQAAAATTSDNKLMDELCSIKSDMIESMILGGE